jgi:hypothetical protein
MSASRDEYARSVGFYGHVRDPVAWLRDMEREAVTALMALRFIHGHVKCSGYARRSCLAVALRAVRGLLAVVRWDLERVSKEE